MRARQRFAETHAGNCETKAKKASPASFWTPYGLFPDSRPLTIFVQPTNTVKKKHQYMDYLLTNASAGLAEWSQQLRSNILEAI
jgi:hypothetical protein